MTVDIVHPFMLPLPPISMCSTTTTTSTTKKLKRAEMRLCWKHLSVFDIATSSGAYLAMKNEPAHYLGY